MQELTMCGYYGMCDSQNNIVGHIGKVTKEYMELLEEEYKVYLLASPCIYDDIRRQRNIVGEKLEYDILMDVPFTIKKRMADKWKIMRNVWECIHNSNTETLFFYQTDFFFFLYICLFYKKKNKKIFALVYQQNFTGEKLEGVLNYIYKKALAKLEGVIYTQKNQAILHDKTLYIPDYLYNADYYEKYNATPKEEKVVCLGTMNRYKQLEKLIDVFKDINIPLEIYGRFDDKERVQQLMERKSDNIVICDCVLSTEDYYQKLGKAKYSILPYDMKQYVSRTSGVLLESIYVGSIPIAPKSLLEQNGMVGYGYDALEDVKEFDWNNKQEEKYVDKIEIILDYNDKFYVGKKMQDFLRVNTLIL